MTLENSYTHIKKKTGVFAIECRTCARENGQLRRSLKRPAVVHRANCIRGHAMTPKNTYIHPTSGKRTCRTCNNAHSAKSKMMGPRHVNVVAAYDSIALEIMSLGERMERAMPWDKPKFKAQIAILSQILSDRGNIHGNANNQHASKEE